MRRESLNRLIRNLSDSRVKKRRHAAEALSAADERAVYPLIKALRDQSPGVQDAAMRSLIAIGGETTAYMVLPLLREDSFLRNTALIILKEIGPVIAPLLRPLLGDKDDDVRKFAIDLLIEIGRCDFVDDLLTVMREDENANVRASAAKAMGIFGDRRAIPHLTQALQDEEWVSFSALEALALIKEESAVESIASLLANPSSTLRYSAIETLGKLGFRSACKHLRDYIPRADTLERPALLKSLLQLGEIPDIPDIDHELMEMFKNGEWEERLIALRGMVKLGQMEAIPHILDVAGSLDPANPDELDIIYEIKSAIKGWSCVEELIHLLKDPNVRYRAKTMAIEIIEEQGCQEAIPHLVALFKGNWRDIKRASIEKLKEISGEDSEEIFLDALEDGDGHVRKSAVSALGKMGGKEIIPDLLKLLAYEPYHDVKEEVVRAILSIDSRNALFHLQGCDETIREMVGKFSDDLEILLTLTRDRDLKPRLAALGRLGTHTDERAKNVLTASLTDNNPEVRKTALLALGDLGAGLEEIVPMLGDADMWVRIYAVRLLGRSLEEKALPHLLPLLKQEEIPVVLSVMEAIEQISSCHKIDMSSVFSTLLDHKHMAIKARAKEITGRLS